MHSHQVQDPVVIYLYRNMPYSAYAIWSIRSLLRFGHTAIEVAVGSEQERSTVLKSFPDICCRTVNVDMGRYPAFSYKPFALVEYLDQHGLAHTGRPVVVCDVDVVWNQNPQPLFRRFAGKNWAHKVTLVDPRDFERNPADVPQSNIGLRTILNYGHRYSLPVYPCFLVNAGLFMLAEDLFCRVLSQWHAKLVAMPAEEMLMSEAILSVVYAEQGLRPTCDDVKHADKNLGDVGHPVLTIEPPPPLGAGDFTGYQTASHYFSDQKKEFYQNVKTNGLDQEGLLYRVKLSNLWKDTRKRFRI